MGEVDGSRMHFSRGMGLSCGACSSLWIVNTNHNHYCHHHHCSHFWSAYYVPAIIHIFSRFICTVPLWFSAFQWYLPHLVDKLTEYFLWKVWVAAPPIPSCFWSSHTWFLCRRSHCEKKLWQVESLLNKTGRVWRSWPRLQLPGSGGVVPPSLFFSICLAAK